MQRRSALHCSLSNFPKKYDWTIFQSQSKPCAEINAHSLHLPFLFLYSHRRRLWFPAPVPGAGQTAGREGQGLADRRCTKIPPKSWHSSALIQGTCSFTYSIPLTLLSHPGTPLPQVPTPYPSCCTPSMSPTHPCLIRIPAAARIPTLQTHRTPHPCSTPTSGPVQAPRHRRSPHPAHPNPLPTKSPSQCRHHPHPPQSQSAHGQRQQIRTHRQRHSRIRDPDAPSQ